MGTVVTRPRSVRSKINQNGRIVIPAAIRQEMGLKTGESVVMALEDGVLRIESYRSRIRRIQEEFRKLIPAGGMLMSDELIAERREEARREEEEMERDRDLYQARWQKAEKVA